MSFTPGQSNPAPLQCFRFNIEPGRHASFDGYGDFAYIAAANGPLELAIDDNTNFFPWDIALALEYNKLPVASGSRYYFRRIAVRNSGAEPLTGILYTGFVTINDHRLHETVKQDVQLASQASTAVEGTLELADEVWQLLVPGVEGRREVWLAAEKTDDDPAPVIAYWRANSYDNVKTPSREIGLALDGITRLPFSDQIDVSCAAASAGRCRIRYWVVTYVAAGLSEPIVGNAAQNEALILPAMNSDASANGDGIFIYGDKVKSGGTYQLFDRNPSSEVKFNNNGGVAVDFGEAKTITRVILKSMVAVSGTNTNANSEAPATVQIYKSADGVVWEMIDSGESIRAVVNGQPVYSKFFGVGFVQARWLKFVFTGVYHEERIIFSGRTTQKVKAHIAAPSLSEIEIYGPAG
ncbi:discoidin domain-containing protein [Termitidicoccus mucosus]|uniref:F5/8 type C domain-containing protein n=1 Tax=Termitidicoccus mucosus TaxID=1184151 RepID=A0A178IES9_9BACT|nr:hypothetical protein AW736_21920 [Opitutaceae bacterium TSB47]